MNWESEHKMNWWTRISNRSLKMRLMIWKHIRLPTLPSISPLPLPSPITTGSCGCRQSSLMMMPKAWWGTLEAHHTMILVQATKLKNTVSLWLDSYQANLTQNGRGSWRSIVSCTWYCPSSQSFKLSAPINGFGFFAAPQPLLISLWVRST